MSSCTGSIKETSQTPIQDLKYRDSVSEVAWHWNTSDEEIAENAIYPVTGGVAAVLDERVIALSGMTGKIMWEHQFPEHSITGDVTDDGRRFMVFSADSKDDTARPRITAIDTSTGDISEEYDLVDDQTAPRFSRKWLNSVYGDHWITTEDSESGDANRVSAHDLGTDTETWSVDGVVGCDDEGSIDALATADDTLVIATTCYERPDDESNVEMTEGQDFISQLIGLSVETGEEVWRTESQTGLFPADSQKRTLTVHGDGHVSVYYPYSDRGQVLNARNGDLTELKDGSVLWANEDASRLGVWEQNHENYWIQQDDAILDSLAPIDRLPLDGTSSGVERSSLVVGLETGLVQVRQEISEQQEGTDLAQFHGFEKNDSIPFSWDGEDTLNLVHARSVPGAVAVSYSSGGERWGIIGLR